MKPQTNLLTCETFAALVIHLRNAGDGTAYYNGVPPGTVSLCGATIGWDVKSELDEATCTVCRSVQNRNDDVND